MSNQTVEIGLPFFDDINSQTRNKSYFAAYYKEWVYPNNRVPQFQFLIPLTAGGVVEFDLVDVYTGVHTDYLTYFNANATIETVGSGVNAVKYVLQDADISEILAEGKYYFYATFYSLTPGVASIFRWSEVFTIGDFEEVKISSSFDQIWAGLPFLNNINNQVSKKSYFNNHIVNWLSPGNRFLPFQINAGTVSGMATFNLINSETGVAVDYLSYFNANAIETLIGTDYYYTHLGLVDVTVTNGRYYFYAVSSGGRIWYSEEFTMCGNLEEETDYLLISETDYLLIGGTDKLRLN